MGTAFEKISRYKLPRFGSDTSIDVREAELPLYPPPDEGYDPRRHRVPKKPIKIWMAYLNLLRTSFGAGVLGLPQAISHAGMILGPIITIFTGLLIMHSHAALLWSLNEISRQLKIPYISYRYGFRIALLHGPDSFQFIGTRGPSIIAFFTFLNQLGICTVFVIFTTDSLRDIMDWPNSHKAIYLLFFAYIFMEFFMVNLKIVSYISMVGNIMNFVGMAIVYYFMLHDPVGDMILFANQVFPIVFSFGMNMFNLSAIGVVLSLDRALVNPYRLTDDCGLLDIGILVPTFVSTIFGVVGYWSFGVMEDNILRSLPYDSNLAMAAIGLYLLAIALAYPIQCHPGVEIFMDVYKNRKYDVEKTDKHLKNVESLCRPIFVFLSFLLCYLLPYQGPFVAFVGNMCTSLLVLVFPAMMELSLMYPGPYGKYNFHLYKNIILMLLGTVTSVIGVIQCGYLLYVRTLFMNRNCEAGYASIF